MHGLWSVLVILESRISWNWRARLAICLLIFGHLLVLTSGVESTRLSKRVVEVVMVIQYCRWESLWFLLFLLALESSMKTSLRPWVETPYLWFIDLWFLNLAYLELIIYLPYEYAIEVCLSLNSFAIELVFLFEYVFKNIDVPCLLIYYWYILGSNLVVMSLKFLLFNQGFNYVQILIFCRVFA